MGFSWLERRWPGAGYEDWATELDGLVERGYDVLRIDAYPHLVAADGFSIVHGHSAITMIEFRNFSHANGYGKLR